MNRLYVWMWICAPALAIDSASWKVFANNRRWTIFGVRCSFFLILFIGQVFSSSLAGASFNIEKNETEKKFHIRNWISPGTQINLFAFREMKRQNTAAFALFSRVRKFIFSPHLTFRVNAFIQIVCSHQLPIGEKKNVWKKREPRKPNAVPILSFFIPLFRWLSSARARSSDSNVWRSETSESAHMCITIKITFWNIICRFSEFLYAERSALAWSKTLSNLNAAFSDFFFSLRLLVFAHSFSCMFFFHHRYRKDLLLFFIFFLLSSVSTVHIWHNAKSVERKRRRQQKSKPSDKRIIKEEKSAHLSLNKILHPKAS